MYNHNIFRATNFPGVPVRFEIGCALLILLSYLTRIAVLLLLTIMGVAFITAKWPELADKGFWVMAHDGRTDFVLTLLLAFLFKYGSREPSVDFNSYAGQKN